MKKIIIIQLIMSIFILSNAQTDCNHEPFKGFHIGIVGQPEFIVKGKVTPLSGNEPAPKSYWTMGGNIGIEMSFNFAKYFGLAAGLRWGTGSYYKEASFIGSVPDIHGIVRTINEYVYPIDYHEFELYVPIKFEFHYPIHKNFYFMAELGCSITGFAHRDYYLKGYNEFAVNCCDNSDIHTLYNMIHGDSKNGTQMVYENVLTRTNGKITSELFAGAGVYYRLPYGDLLRLSIGYNAAFHTTFEGKYNYFLSNSTGKCEVRHNCIYAQLGYFHTFVYEKNKRCLKKQSSTAF